MNVPVSLEVGGKKTFASAIDWPGWSRGGRDEEAALTALVDYAPRYARVLKLARMKLPALPETPDQLEVVERIKGGTSTDFGIPSLPGPSDERPVDEVERKRLSAFFKACWAAFDAAALAAEGVELRKGPRGGGRDVPKMTGHVLEAERAYLGQLGSKPPPGGDDLRADMATLHDAVLAVLAARVHGEPLPDPKKVKRPWSPRYFLRRAAWHVLDHAWEIEDRAAR